MFSILFESKSYGFPSFVKRIASTHSVHLAYIMLPTFLPFCQKIPAIFALSPLGKYSEPKKSEWNALGTRRRRLGGGRGEGGGGGRRRVVSTSLGWLA